MKVYNHKAGPEAKIQNEIIRMLRYKEWFVKETHGNMYQSGFPDLYACHRTYGARWIEVKNPESFVFTPAQLKDFPMFKACNIGIWILGSSSEEEYLKLFKPANWEVYLMQKILRSKGC